jgi:hypothetical protein
MKKVALLVAFILALTPLAFAQGTVKAGRPDTVEVIITGEVDVPGYYRSEEIVGVLERTGALAAQSGTGWGAGDGAEFEEESDAAYVPLVVINFDAQMGKKVFTHVTLKTNRLAGNGIGANGGSMIATADIGIPVKTAYVEVQEFLFEETTFKFGLQNLVYDLRGKGAFFMDIANSEEAWMTPVVEAWACGSFYGPSFPGVTADTGVGLYRSGTNPGGFLVNYTTKDEVFSMDFYGFNVMETLNAHFDEQVYGIEFAYTFPGSKEEKNKSYLSGIINCIQADQGASKIWTIGIGVDYFWDNFEFYGELYYQFGKYWDEEVAGPLGDDEIDQQAWAGYIGLKYTFAESTAKPWIDFSFTWISGDNGDLGDSDPENEDFVSYENNNATMIVEDNLLGLDIDSNYWKLMLDMGASFKLHEDNDFTISLTSAYFQIVDETDFDDDTIVLDDDLGIEADLKFSWAYSKQCTFGLNFGFLFSADFFAGDPADDAVDGDWDGGYCIDDDSMFMCVFDTNVKW